MVIDRWAKYGKPISNKISYGPDTKTCQNPYKFDNEVKYKVVRTQHIVLWWYSHVPNMVSQCQTKKKLWVGHESSQTDGETEWFLNTPLNFVQGGGGMYNWYKIFISNEMRRCVDTFFLLTIVLLNWYVISLIEMKVRVSKLTYPTLRNYLKMLQIHVMNANAMH